MTDIEVTRHMIILHSGEDWCNLLGEGMPRAGHSYVESEQFLIAQGLDSIKR